MEKIEKGAKVTVELSAEAKANLAIHNPPKGECTVIGHYPLGHYIREGSTGPTIAIADRYGAIKRV